MKSIFIEIGAKMVLDMTLFTAMALELSYQEFKARYCEENQAKI